jgi:hypothetical protein
VNARLWVFSGTDAGEFSIDSIVPIVGDTLPAAPCLTVTPGPPVSSSRFSLSGVASNERYTTRAEKSALVSKQQALGRAEASQGALIPIKKSQAWWDLTQDERRAVFEERSRHVQLGLEALPQVARRLHHCRDLATTEPFDFLTWFDFREEDRPKFDDLLGALRASEEWQYVEREVEIRVRRAPTARL